MRDSSIFGLVDYSDQTGRWRPRGFDFRVASLQVRFANSACSRTSAAGSGSR